jgi:hypothetical protein
MAARCSSCGAAIVWIETPKGKYMPADEGMVPYKSDPHGKDSVVTQKGEVIRCRILTTPEEADGMARVPHWATCPHADKYRRRV